MRSCSLQKVEGPPGPPRPPLPGALNVDRQVFGDPGWYGMIHDDMTGKGRISGIYLIASFPDDAWCMVDCMGGCMVMEKWEWTKKEKLQVLLKWKR